MMEDLTEKFVSGGNLTHIMGLENLYVGFRFLTFFSVLNPLKTNPIAVFIVSKLK